MANKENVVKWRKSKGNELQNELYKTLREKYNIPSKQACKMKYWSKKRIMTYLLQNDLIEVSDI